MDEGCNGGFMTLAYDQIISMGGLESEDDYQYEGKQHNQCQLDKTKIKVQINGYLNITSDENGNCRTRRRSLIACDFFLQEWLNG